MAADRLRRSLLVAGLCWTLGVGCAAQAIEFQLRDLQGQVQTLEQYRGKWVLVNFWATWCPPCLEEIPDLVFLHDRNQKKDLVVIGVAMDYKSVGEIREFGDKMLISYPLVLGDSKVRAQFGRISGLPTTLLYDRKGKLVAQHVGPLTREAVERYIRGK